MDERFGFHNLIFWQNVSSDADSLILFGFLDQSNGFWPIAYSFDFVRTAN